MPPQLKQFQHFFLEVPVQVQDPCFLFDTEINARLIFINFSNGNTYFVRRTREKQQFNFSSFDIIGFL